MSPESAYQKAKKMTIPEIAQKAGVAHGDATPNTYLYINDDGEFDYMSSVDRNSRPIDEFAFLGTMDGFSQEYNKVK